MFDPGFSEIIFTWTRATLKIYIIYPRHSSPTVVYNINKFITAKLHERTVSSLSRGWQCLMVFMKEEQSVVLPKLDIENASLFVMHKSSCNGGSNAWDDIISKCFSDTYWHERINVLLKSSGCKHCRKSLNSYRIHPIPENMKTISLCFVRSRYTNLSCLQKVNN